MLVGDMLHDGAHDFPGLMVDHIAVPMGVELRQFVCHSVVFSHEESVHGEETELLVRSQVSGQEARDVCLRWINL